MISKNFKKKPSKNKPKPNQNSNQKQTKNKPKTIQNTTQVDRLYGWKANPDLPIRDAFKRQKPDVGREFDDRSSQVFLQLNEQGLNVALYWKNPDPRK